MPQSKENISFALEKREQYLRRNIFQSNGVSWDSLQEGMERLNTSSQGKGVKYILTYIDCNHPGEYGAEYLFALPLRIWMGIDPQYGLWQIICAKSGAEGVKTSLYASLLHDKIANTLYKMKKPSEELSSK